MTDQEELDIVNRIRSKDWKILGGLGALFIVWSGWISSTTVSTAADLAQVADEQERRGLVIDTIPDIRRDVDVLRNNQQHQGEDIKETKEAVKDQSRKLEELDRYLRDKLD